MRLKLLHAPGIGPDGAMTDGVVEHVTFAPADLRDLRCLVGTWLDRVCAAKPEYELKFFTDRRSSDLTDEEYKDAVASGSLIVEVVLHGPADPKDMRLCYWDTMLPGESVELCDGLSVSNLSDGLGSVSEALDAASSPSGTDSGATSGHRRSRSTKSWTEDVVSEFASALAAEASAVGAFAGRAVAAAGMRFRSFVSLRRGMFSESPLLLTATKMLGSDFSQALLALSMTPPSKKDGSPDCYYRFYLGGADGRPFCPKPFAPHLIFRTRFGRLPITRWPAAEPERPLELEHRRE